MLAVVARVHARCLVSFAVVASLAALALPRVAAAQADLVTGLGGPHGFGTNVLPENDDGSSAAIDVRPAFSSGLRFFAPTPFTTLYVNNNGNITFRQGLPTYTPDAFPISDQPMIAPWWGDVDTRGGGVPTGEGVFWDLRAGQFTVTWWNVGYYNSHNDKRNSFQLIIREAAGCGVGSFDVEFRYNQCQWTTGDASMGVGGLGGTPAQAGFDAGDRTNFFTLPGSRTMAVLNLCTTSNVGMPGVWRFRIAGGALPCAGSGAACEVTTAVGACREGTLQCRGAGTACVASTTPTPERCDGLDNDCNGMTDEGTNLCPAGQVCDRAVCVPRCVEDGCFAGQTCTSRGTCVETACVTVDCPAGQRCTGGRCVDACDGVRCDPGLVCRAGGCVDTCAGMTCGDGEVCEEGRCQPRCECRTCGAGLTCRADGRCGPPDCTGADCDGGGGGSSDGGSRDGGTSGGDPGGCGCRAAGRGDARDAGRAALASLLAMIATALARRRRRATQPGAGTRTSRCTPDW